MIPPTRIAEITALAEQVRRKAFRRGEWFEPHGTIDVPCDHNDERAEAYFVNPDGPEASAALTELLAEREAMVARVAAIVDKIACIAASAIDAVSDAERESDWNIPTFGPTTSECLAERLADMHEPLADVYARLSGKPYHASDCATSCAPAELPHPCDCPPERGDFKETGS